MKNKILLLGAGLFLIASSACKKGENDPLLSLATRKARLCKTWELTSASWNAYDIINEDGVQFISDTDYSFDGTNMTFSQTLIGPDSTVVFPPEVYPYATTLTFNKDGSFSSIYTSFEETVDEEGFWEFAGANKVYELKKKEAVVISISKVNTPEFNYTAVGSAIDVDHFFLIDRLTSKEMVITLDSKNTYSDGNSYTRLGSWTYTAK
jgi:hypothetical protein